MTVERKLKIGINCEAWAKSLDISGPMRVNFRYRGGFGGETAGSPGCLQGAGALGVEGNLDLT